MSDTKAQLRARLAKLERQGNVVVQKTRYAFALCSLQGKLLRLVLGGSCFRALDTMARKAVGQKPNPMWEE